MFGYKLFLITCVHVVIMFLHEYKQDERFDNA